jgi:hypothetical protein
VYLLLIAAENAAFDHQLLGYHAVNVVGHALVSTLLVVLLMAWGAPRWAALAGGAIFLLHPANVQTVAWVSQSKTLGATALALGALLLHRRRPGLALVLFASALLFKAHALFALPVAATLEWTRRHDAEAAGLRRRAVWLGGWALVALLFAYVQFPVFERTNLGTPPMDPDPLVNLRSLVAIAARYLVMAYTGYGVAAFQQPPAASSWLDPWWLGGLGALALLAARLLWTLGRGRTEAVYWVWAAAAYAPVSQIFPFLFPMADHYLYPILPGLIGASLSIAIGALDRMGDASRRRSLALAGLALSAALAGYFGARATERARLWRVPVMLQVDSARAFPDGMLAHLSRAEHAARFGDAPTAATALAAAQARGFNRFEPIATEAVWAPVRSDPRFQVVLRDLARWWADREEQFSDPSQFELRALAHANLVLERYEDAARLYRRALEIGGPQDDVVRTELAEIEPYLSRSRTAGETPSVEATR